MAWVVGVGVAIYYQPKDSYDIGDEGSMRTLAQERNEDHMILGCLLMPVQFVVAAWTTAFDSIRNRE